MNTWEYVDGATFTSAPISRDDIFRTLPSRSSIRAFPGKHAEPSSSIGDNALGVDVSVEVVGPSPVEVGDVLVSDSELVP